MRSVAIANETLLPIVAEMLSEGSVITLKTKGSSMLPFIVGDEDSVVLKKNENIRIGEVVLAKVANEQFVLHRIVKIDGDTVTLMGDGNLREVEECSIADIYGCVNTIIHQGKRIDCNKRSERIKAHMWRKLLPARRLLLKMYNTYNLFTSYENKRRI